MHDKQEKEKIIMSYITKILADILTWEEARPQSFCS